MVQFVIRVSMKLTIIRDMGLVHEDGEGHIDLDLSSVPTNIHALQWYGSEGEIEYNDGTNNELITALPTWAESARTVLSNRNDEVAAEEAAHQAYLDSEQGKAETVRQERDLLLQETDWMALSDVTMSTQWANYRQALRDIPDQNGFPFNVTYPTKPE